MTDSHSQPTSALALKMARKRADDHKVEIATLKARVAELEANEAAYESILGKRTYNEVAEHIDGLESALHQIDSWSRAYPLRVFPEPDLKKVRELLEAGGITLDSVSASCMRHCVEGVGKIASTALSHAGPVARDGER